MLSDSRHWLQISEVTDFEQEINVGDAESAELPVSVESCLALNRAYQEVIVDVLRQTEASLEENRQKQVARFPWLHQNMIELIVFLEFDFMSVLDPQTIFKKCY